MIGKYRESPPVGSFVPARHAPEVWEQTQAVVRAALTFAGTWRRCYEDCECIRCDLAIQADQLARMVSRRDR